MRIPEKILDRLRRTLGVVSPSRMWMQPPTLPDRPLKIAFIAWDARQAENALLQFAIDNCAQIKRFERRRRIILYDGTEIVNVHNQMLRDGQRFDQYIIADDSRKNVLKFRGAVLNELDCRCGCSIVPEEYRCQFYNIDEEAPRYDV